MPPKRICNKANSEGAVVRGFTAAGLRRSLMKQLLKVLVDTLKFHIIFILQRTFVEYF